jgi:hypothetical protein
MPLASPFTNRDLASNVLTTIPPRPSVASTIVSGVKDLSGIFGKVGEGQERQAKIGLYGAQSENQRAEAGQHTAEASKIASEVADKARTYDDFQRAGEEYTRVFTETHDPQAAERARQAVLSGEYGTKDGYQGIRAMGVDRNIVEGVAPMGADPTVVSPTLRVARDLATGGIAAEGHALQSGEGRTSLTYGDQRGDIAQTAADARAKVAADNAAKLAGDRLQAGATVESANIQTAGRSRDVDLETKRDLYGKIFPLTYAQRVANEVSQGRLPTATKPGESTQKVTTDPKGKTLKTETTTPYMPPLPGPKIPATAPAGPAQAARPATIQPLPPGYTKAQAITDAKAAIAAGRDRNGVLQKLAGYGINPAEIGP